MGAGARGFSFGDLEFFSKTPFTRAKKIGTALPIFDV